VATLKYATAVGLMVHCGYTEAIELLVKQFQADVNAVSDDLGHTPVAQACAAGDFKLAKVLLQLGGSLHSTLADSLHNPLHEAVLACSTERVIGLLLLDAEHCSSNGGSVQLLPQQDSAGRTPLHLCAALPAGTANRNEVWQLLLSRSDPAALYTASKQQDVAAGSTVVHALVYLKPGPMLHKLLRAYTNSECVAAILAVEDAQGVGAVLLAQHIGHKKTIVSLEPCCEEVRAMHQHLVSTVLYIGA
jgi:Ankyrin repeats (3 copies)/Ankyrin repeat